MKGSSFLNRHTLIKSGLSMKYNRNTAAYKKYKYKTHVKYLQSPCCVSHFDILNEIYWYLKDARQGKQTAT